MIISEVYRRLLGDIFFHYTCVENMESIRACNNTLYSKNKLAEYGVTPKFMVDNASLEQDKKKGFDDYVFVAFLRTHPMIFKKQNSEGFKLQEICLDVSILDIPGVWVVDRVATDGNANFYSAEIALNHMMIEHCHGRRVERGIWENIKKYEIMVPNSINLNQYECEG